MFKKTNLVSVPKSLSQVTHINSKAETSPYDVNMTRDNVEAIWSSVESFYRTGLQPGLSLVIRKHGEVILDRAIGHARGNEPTNYTGISSEKVPLTTDTPICLFSASKAITAMLIHKLEEQGKLNINELVSKYIPEFGTNGKENVTISQVLSHRAGVPTIPIKNPDPSLLFRWTTVIDLINAGYARDADSANQAYHAITGGYVLGEIVQRVTGKPVNQFLQETISKPLGAKYLSYGLPEAQHALAAYNYSTGANPVFPVNILAKRALGIEFEKISNISNTPEFFNACIPAGNIYGTADEVSRFYQMMLNGGSWEGRQVFKPETIQKAIQPAGPLTLDGMLMIPMRFSNGFMLGEKLVSLYGTQAAKAYGHLGLINIVTWADPARDISVALLNTGKSLDPRSLPALGKILFSISKNCPVVQ